jgi:hypothetical protein
MSSKIILDNAGQHIATVIKHRGGTSFYTRPELDMQVACMKLKEDQVVKPHRHTLQTRTIVGTAECIIVQCGTLLCHIYDDAGVLLTDVFLAEGDIVLLLRGGHAFKAITPVDLIEVKQGPYDALIDKEYFDATVP